MIQLTSMSLPSASILFLSLVLMIGPPALAREESKRTKATADVSAKAPNPVAHLHSVAFKNTLDFGAPNGSAYFLNIIPIIPATFGHWSVINRPIIPIIDVPGFISGTPNIPTGAPGDGAFGLGDINYSAFFSPAGEGKFDWGIGPALSFPSATDDQLGSGKWSAGPTAAVFFMRKPWVGALIVRQLWSFAGDSDRADVNQFLLQPILTYGLGKGWALVTDMTITANWGADSDNRWTVPLGGGISKFLTISNQPIIARLDAYYNVERPENAPDWSANFLIRFLFPK